MTPFSRCAGSAGVRLGRLEDLLGANPALADQLPEGDIGHGFDHLGEVLSFTPVHLEQASGGRPSGG